MESMFGYKILRTLGKGKTGTAYLVQNEDDKLYVLKVMNQDCTDYEKQFEIFSSLDCFC